MLSARTREQLEATAKAIRDRGGGAPVAPCDVADPVQIQAVIDHTAAEYGRIDIVTCAAIAPVGAVAESSGRAANHDPLGFDRPVRTEVGAVLGPTPGSAG